MTLPRYHVLPFGFITWPKFDGRQICRLSHLHRSTSTHAAAHMLNNIAGAIVPTVQREPTPQYAAVDDAAMIAKSATHCHV